MMNTELKPSAALSALSYIASLVPLPYANVASKIFSMGAVAARSIGYSRPKEEAGALVLARSVGNTALGAGAADQCYHLGVDSTQGSNMHHAQYPFGSADDDKLATHFQRWSQLVKDFQEGVEQSVEPWPYAGILSNLHPTSRDYFTAPFQYWRGTMRARFVVHSSPLIRWRMGVVVLNPGVATPVAFPTNGSYPTYILEVAGSTVLDIDIPYPYTIWSELDNHVGTVAGVTRVAFFSLMDPSGPTGPAPTPYVDLWVASGPDWEVARPWMNILNGYYAAEGRLLPEGKLSAYSFGENVETISLLSKKPVQVLKYTTATATSGFFELQVPSDWGVPAPSTFGDALTGLVTSTASSWSYASWLRRAFIGYNGSTCFRLACSNTGGAVFQVSVYEADDRQPGSLVPNPVSRSDLYTAMGTQHGANFFEVCTTPTMAHLFKPTDVVNPWQNTELMKCVVVQPISTIYTESVVGGIVYSSAGDDFSVGGFLAPPKLTFRVEY